MKKLLLSATLFFFFFYATSQTVTWNSASGIDTNWNTDANWDSGSIPGAINDVIIPDGFVVDVNIPGADIISLDLQGSAILNIKSGFNFTGTFTVGAGATVNWIVSNITGGGVLTNEGTIILEDNVGNLGVGTVGVTVENNNIINLTGIGDIFLSTNSVLNNNASGVIDIQSNFSGISKLGNAPHILNNSGIIKSRPPLATDQVSINVQINNNNGTIQVESGILHLPSNSAPNMNTYTDGFFNIFSGSTMNLTNTSTYAGNIGGGINGTLNSNGFIAVPVAATLDFGGTEIINFSGSIIGGGTLTNKSIIRIATQPVLIQDASTTLINQELIEFTAAGDLSVQTGSTLNNDASGTIDFKGDTGNILSSQGPPNTFINTGLIKTSFVGDGSDTAEISAQLSNDGGTIEINNGTLSLNKIGISLNGGVYNIANDGIFDWDDDVAISGSLTGNIQGVLNWNDKVIITGAASLDFGGTQIISWIIGSIDGGGVLTNNNIINIGNFNTNIFGGTTLNNNNVINITDDDSFIIATNGVFNNQMFGTLNLLGNGASIGTFNTNQGTFNNFGDIIVDLPNITDNANIFSKFNNNNANMEIRKGILNLNNVATNEQNLFDGVYNIFPDGTFNWENDLTLSGELTGQVDGPLNWNDALWVNAATTATFFFTGQKKIFWTKGSLNGGGTLINRSDIDITNLGNVNVNGGTTLNNGRNLNLTTFGDLGIATNSTLNNLLEGTIELQVGEGNIIPIGVAPQTFNNLGTLKATSVGSVSVDIDTDNSGSIEIISGELEFSETRTLHNETTGVIKGSGTLNLPAAANFTNDGKISPGTSPGTLTVLGDYSSTPTAILAIEMDGLVQGTEFDFIPITGNNVVFDGSVDITIGFDASINDEFVIATTTGTISTCSLDSPVSASFGGSNYEFDVICRNDKEVVLTVTNETLGIESNELTADTILLYPNPVTNQFTLINNTTTQLINAMVYDITGNIIEDINLEGIGNEKLFSIENYASGVYFMRITSSSNSIVKQLVKR